ncbi:MAG: DUF1634 domain-containing protein [Melioribacter sp.]|nr:DUF1634 domain-containing protein [Melioribacter sp.]
MEDIKLNRTVSKILAAGIYTTIFLYGIGILLLLINNKPHTFSSKSLEDIIMSFLSFNTESFLYAGTITLILTPIFRVFVSVIFFLKSGDKKFFYITLLVAIILLLSIFFGIFFSIKLG